MEVPEVGWDEGTNGERVWGTRGGRDEGTSRESMKAQRLDGMRVQVEREYGGPELGVG